MAWCLSEAKEEQMDLARYDELHVISDLHMGGDRLDFQILRETKRLANFVRWVAGQRPGGRVALVLNGDIVDTLAEDTGGYIAFENAAATLERIMNNASFAGVWAALADFAKTPNRTLVLAVGNHDLELALPPVQRLIIERLAGEDLATRARIEFSTLGAGYACQVGSARVFCTHGNEVDPWNYVRYEDMSRLARRLNAGRALMPSEWEPNAGTRMVKDVMNEVKKRYAWIDLLKPETQAAVGVLVVLDPSQASKITRLPGIVAELARGGREFEGRLNADASAAPRPATDQAASIDRLLGANVAKSLKVDGQAGGRGPGPSAEDMLMDAELTYKTPRVRGAGEDETLGVPRLLLDRLTGWISGVGKDEALRRALLDWLAGDETFNIGNRDETFVGVTKSVGSGVDVIVTGHTHLERAIDMGGGRFYFNCGTWIRLLQFGKAMLETSESFKSVYDVLEDGRMSAIDGFTFNGVPFVMNQTSAVRITAEPAGVVGALGHVDGVDPIVWNEIQRFVRS
jgi:UDP-2,3-diacylglucosamine pyrophosphatase LpxH